MAAEEAKAAELELWNNAGCPFGQRAWWAIIHKKIPQNQYTIHWEDLANKSDGFKAAYKKALFSDPNKEGTTPTIQHKGKYLTESDVCAKYIERAFEGNSIAPSDPYNEFVIDKLMKEHFGALISSMFAAIKNEDPKGEKLLSALKSFNNTLTLQGNHDENCKEELFFFGKEFTYFEIFFFPIFYRFEAVEAITGVPVLSKWLNGESKSDESKDLKCVINWYNVVNKTDDVKEMRKIADLDYLKKSFEKFRK